VKIVTFGSCLSRYTAAAYSQLFGAKVISSVFHNRSDFFVGKFIDKNWADYGDAELADILRADEETAGADDRISALVRNQHPKTIGLHRLSKGLNFIEAIESNQADLVIIDNYMDLSGRLMSRSSALVPEGMFLRLRDFKIQPDGWYMGGYLSSEQGVYYMTRIVEWIQEKNPKSKIVFLNFPHNTYVNATDRINRTKRYEELFTFKGGLIVPCLTVPPAFQTKDKQHFQMAQYCAYAGIVWSEFQGKSLY
jgi:hypothetical protein